MKNEQLSTANHYYVDINYVDYVKGLKCHRKQW